MNRQYCKRVEQELRRRGVYKPFVSVDQSMMFCESYPLTVIVRSGGCDPERGPFHALKLTDCSLPRIGQDPVLTTCCVYVGQDVAMRIAELLKDYHEVAYARAKEQDARAIARLS